MEIVAVAIGLVGALPVVAAGCFYVAQFLPARRLLRFGRRTRVDIVMTTSLEDVSGKGPPIRRYLTGIGQVQGVTQAARAIGRFFHGKEIRTHLSARVTNRLDSDLIILGGPVRNQIAADYLSALNRPRTVGIEFDDVSCTARMPGGVGVDDFDLEMVNGIPSADIALVVVDKNPFSAGRGTVVLCCGFTSFGTAAAAEFLFDDLMNRTWWRRYRQGYRWTSRPRAGFLAVARVRISAGGSTATFTPLTVTSLRSQ